MLIYANVGGEGVFSQGMSERRLGKQFQTSSCRNTLTYVYPLWKTPFHSVRGVQGGAENSSL